MPNNPLLQKIVNFSDLESGLRNIHGDIESVLDVLEKHNKRNSGDSEMNFLMAMSGLELKMSQLCKEFRESFL
jgi:hypothetical protein